MRRASERRADPVACGSALGLSAGSARTQLRECPADSRWGACRSGDGVGTPMGREEVRELRSRTLPTHVNRAAGHVDGDVVQAASCAVLLDARAALQDDVLEGDVP